MTYGVLLIFLLINFLLLMIEITKATMHERGINCGLTDHRMIGSIGGLIDRSSRLGREQRIAMGMAVQDFHQSSTTCSKLILTLRDSYPNSAGRATAAIDLINRKHVQAIVGALSLPEATLISEFNNVTDDIPIISISPTATSPPSELLQPPLFIQMGNDITTHTQCIAAIVGHFRWRKVTAIYERQHGFAGDSGLVTQLSDSLRVVDSVIDYHSAFPLLSSLSDPKSFIEEELRNLKIKNNRVFIVLKSSIEFAIVLFETAKQMGMVENGYVWIVSDEISSFLDSVGSSVTYTMQGVVGFKTNFLDTTVTSKDFKLKFRKKYSLKYPEEEEFSNPSIFALQAYDATLAIAIAMQNSQKNVTTSKELLETILASNFGGLSGEISFKDGKLVQKLTFQIINVVGKSYRKVAFWSPELGFSENNFLGSVYWPGGNQTVPKGWAMGNGEKPLRIGVPASGAFNQFVSVSYDKDRQVTGFSVDVFEAAVRRLTHHLPYELVPFYGRYDDMVKQVYNKSLDAAVGDISIVAERYEFVEFSQPYLDSGLVMIVPVKPDRTKELWMFMKTFNVAMWALMAGMGVFVGFVVWLIEYESNNPDFEGSFSHQVGTMLWFSVTILSLAQRESIRSNLSRAVITSWLLVVLVVAACYTAILTSKMTVSRLHSSVIDIEHLKRTNAPVGCNVNSFAAGYLENFLHFHPENIKKINSIDKYHETFARGDIVAAFFIEPHAKVFLAQYCKGYTMAGPTFKLGGLGFVFPKGSPLATDISEAILKVTQSGEVNLEKYMLSFSKCSTSTQIPSLGPEPFSGLLMISGGISTVAFVITLARLIGKNWSFFSWTQATLINRRTFSWAVLFLSQRYMKFGFQFSRESSVQDTNDQSVVMSNMEENSMIIELAGNQNIITLNHQ